jgi:hypothetical protein
MGFAPNYQKRRDRRIAMIEAKNVGRVKSGIFGLG